MFRNHIVVGKRLEGLSDRASYPALGLTNSRALCTLLKEELKFYTKEVCKQRKFFYMFCATYSASAMHIFKEFGKFIE